ncbi:hypothetical protein DF186_16505, partial [Enterococcus hirae]
PLGHLAAVPAHQRLATVLGGAGLGPPQVLARREQVRRGERTGGEVGRRQGRRPGAVGQDGGHGRPMWGGCAARYPAPWRGRPGIRWWSE